MKDTQAMPKNRPAIVVLAFLGAVSTVSRPAVAFRLIVQSPCDATPWLDTDGGMHIGQSVGAATVGALNRARIPFEGDDAGIRSIRNTVSGEAAIEVVSDSEMRAYGWCYSVNGVEPSASPDRVFLQQPTDVIHWYFGFAHHKNGDWISYCTPTHVAKPAYICP